VWLWESEMRTACGMTHQRHRHVVLVVERHAMRRRGSRCRLGGVCCVVCCAMEDKWQRDTVRCVDDMSHVTCAIADTRHFHRDSAHRPPRSAPCGLSPPGVAQAQPPLTFGKNAVLSCKCLRAAIYLVNPFFGFYIIFRAAFSGAQLPLWAARA